jgi:hypothetical protein
MLKVIIAFIKPRKPMKTSMMKVFTTTKVDDAYIQQVAMFREIWRQKQQHTQKGESI